MIYVAIKLGPLSIFCRNSSGGWRHHYCCAIPGLTFLHKAGIWRFTQTQKATSCPHCLLTEESGFSFRTLSSIRKWFISCHKSYARTRSLQVVESPCTVVHDWPLYRYYWSKADYLHGLTDFEWASIRTTMRKWVGSHNSRPRLSRSPTKSFLFLPGGCINILLWRNDTLLLENALWHSMDFHVAQTDICQIQDTRWTMADREEFFRRRKVSLQGQAFFCETFLSVRRHRRQFSWSYFVFDFKICEQIGIERHVCRLIGITVSLI